MLHKVGRFMQFVGLLMLPAAIGAQLGEHISVGQMFLWAAIGILVFYIGRNLLQKES